MNWILCPRRYFFMSRSPRFLRPLAAIALAFAALPVAAAHIELQAGRSYMDSRAANAVFVESVFAAHPLGDTGVRWAPDLSLGWINGRDIERYRHARYGPGDWYSHFFYGFQVALHSGRTQALSSAYEFVNTVGWQWRHLSFQVRHISNGKLHEPNRGETMALVGVGFDL